MRERPRSVRKDRTYGTGQWIQWEYMSEVESDVERERGELAQQNLTDRPAVGIVATADNVAAVATAVLRAWKRAYQPFVIPASDEAEEALEFARELDARVVEPRPDGTHGSRPIDDLVVAARSMGFPGVMHHADPDQRINYEETATALLEDSSYLMDAIPAEDAALDHDIVVGIPAYNEEVGLGSVILGAKEFADEIIVVDDGSRDRTAEVAESAGATVLQHDDNRGKGAAIQTLFDVVETMDYEALVLLDGDGQHAPTDIHEVVDPVLEREADLVIGSRYLEENEDDETPRYRRFGQRVLDTLTLGSSRTKVSDSQSGFRALSPTAVDRLSITAETFGVETEMIDSAAREQLAIQERPIDVRYEGIDGQTQGALRHGLSVVTFILSLVRDRHPLMFFGLPGMVLLALGGWYGIDAILVYQASGAFYPGKVLVSGFLTILGTLGLFIGLVLNRIGNMIDKVEAE